MSIPRPIRRWLAAGRAAAGLVLAALPAAHAADVDVGVSVRIGQPGFYGVIDIGTFPRPVLVSPRPVILVEGGHRPRPLYLNVPPGHRKNWRKHCHRYDACGTPVYFVRNDWYDGVYAPEYRRRHGGDDERGGRHAHREGHGDRDRPHGHDRDHDRDRGGKGRGPDRDHGHGPGRGDGEHGKGRGGRD